MFVWHSKGTEESATAIAQAMNCEHGTVPPMGYEGEVFCYGAAPADNFNWAGRNFTKVINDPRIFRKYRDMAVVGEKLGTGITGESVRIFCVGGKVKKIIGNGINTNGVEDTIIEGILISLGNPEVVALDGALSFSGNCFTLTKVIFGAALTGHEDIIAEVVKVAEPTPEEDKKALQGLIDGADPNELRALRKMLSKLKEEITVANTVNAEAG